MKHLFTLTFSSLLSLEVKLDVRKWKSSGVLSNWDTDTAAVFCDPVSCESRYKKIRSWR